MSREPVPDTVGYGVWGVPKARIGLLLDRARAQLVSG